MLFSQTHNSTFYLKKISESDHFKLVEIQDGCQILVVNAKKVIHILEKFYFIYYIVQY